MHNTGLDEVFFVTQFIKGLRTDLRAGVQSQVPKTVRKAVMLAKIQQQLLEDKKSRSSKFSPSPKSSLSSVKTDTHSSSSSVSPLWKERQLRDYRKSNGLCMYCGDKYDKAHATSCTKRP